MGELITIDKAAADFGVSSRALRHWEAAGLFASGRDGSSGWRTYDARAVSRIRFTCVLRSLDFPIGDIKEILDGKSVESLKEALKKQLRKLDSARADLTERKAAVGKLLAAVEKGPFSLAALEKTLLPDSVRRKKHLLGGIKMEAAKSKFEEIKLVKHQAARAAAYSCVGLEPENEAHGALTAWLEKANLQGTARVYAFNVEPYPTDESPEYGMGFCATVPEGVEIPAPLYEMRLHGGVYAVVSDYEGDPSYGWKKINELLQDPNWEWEWDGGRGPGLEEHVERAEGGFIIPIHIPVKRRA